MAAWIRLAATREPKKLSLSDAFAAQGVRLKYGARSWSGIREADGCVVFGMRDAEVRRSAEGFSCLLWSRAGPAADRASSEERLGHCRRALLLGGADGFIASGEAAQVDEGAVLGLRVEARDNEYWAFWGATARAPTLGSDRMPAFAFGLMRLAA